MDVDAARLPALHARPELQKNKKARKNWKIIKSRENTEKKGAEFGVGKKSQKNEISILRKYENK